MRLSFKNRVFPSVKRTHLCSISVHLFYWCSRVALFDWEFNIFLIMPHKQQVGLLHQSCVPEMTTLGTFSMPCITENKEKHKRPCSMMTTGADLLHIGTLVTHHFLSHLETSRSQLGRPHFLSAVTLPFTRSFFSYRLVTYNLHTAGKYVLITWKSTGSKLDDSLVSLAFWWLNEVTL